MSDIDKILRLMSSDALEVRMAAAIVLGELRAKGPHVADALAGALDGGSAPLQGRALIALARTGARRAVPKILPLLGAREDDVRQAAIAAMISVGDAALPVIRERMTHATPDEKRSIDAILAALGGKDAFHVLLNGLGAGDGEAAKAAAIAVRQCVRDADPRQRRSYFVETKRFLEETTKHGGSSAVLAAGVKILGFLEDDEAIPTLLAFAKSGRNEPVIRQEAIIALRFLLGETRDGGKKRGRAPPGKGRTLGAVVAALIDAAEDPDPALAKTALHTLASVRIPGDAARRLERLVHHPDIERARLALEMLAQQDGEEPARVLVGVLASTKDRRRAEIAAACLLTREGNAHAGTVGSAPVRPEAIAPLARALVDSTDADRAWLLRSVLRPSAKQIPRATRKNILEAGLQRLAGGIDSWEPLVATVRDADAGAAVEGLRALAQRMAKKNPSRSIAALRALCRSEACSDDDRYALAAAELALGPRDTRASARAADESLRLFGALVDRGTDIAARLRKDRSVDLEHLYYVGFHFSEQGSPLGEELLRTVAERGGRAKIARMARSKLELSRKDDAGSS